MSQRADDTAARGPESTEQAAGGSAFRSPFGGLWTDRLEASEQVAGRRSRGLVTDAEAAQLAFWIEHGYVVIENAVSHAVVDALVADLESAWQGAHPGLQVDVLSQVQPLRPDLRHEKTKLLDFYVCSEPARQAVFAEPIVRFLELVFDNPPLAFQSLSFERGTEQAMHQDTAYVVVTSPLELAAAWIALEDIEPGSGELEYFAGSHRIEDHLFSGRYKHWSPPRDGHDVHRHFLEAIQRKSAARGCPRLRFQPRKGDALIWAADLVHGGSPIEQRDCTRRSLVAHYCPADVVPLYFLHVPSSWRTGRCGRGRYASLYYPQAIASRGQAA